MKQRLSSLALLFCAAMADFNATGRSAKSLYPHGRTRRGVKRTSTHRFLPKKRPNR